MSEIKNQELIEALAKTGFMTLLNVDTVNHKPHMFMVGSQHIQRFAMDLTKPCAMKGCNLLHSEHTYDTVAFLQLTQQLTQDQANTVMKDIQDILVEKKIDGIVMVETPEQFRIV